MDSPCWPELGVTFSHLEASGGLRAEDPVHGLQVMLDQMETGQETCGECSGLALAVIHGPDHTDRRGRTGVTFGCRNTELREGTNNSYTGCIAQGLDA